MADGVEIVPNPFPERMPGFSVVPGVYELLQAMLEHVELLFGGPSWACTRVNLNIKEIECL